MSIHWWSSNRDRRGLNTRKIGSKFGYFRSKGTGTRSPAVSTPHLHFDRFLQSCKYSQVNDYPQSNFERTSYPRNHDPVTCTELAMLSKLAEEFDERNCKLLAIGVDSKSGHRQFIKETQVKTQSPTTPLLQITTDTEGPTNATFLNSASSGTGGGRIQLGLMAHGRRFLRHLSLRRQPINQWTIQPIIAESTNQLRHKAV